MSERKISRDLRRGQSVRKDRTKKRIQHFNPKTAESDEGNFSTSAKKINAQEEIIVPEDNSIEYRILNFVTVFAAISMFVKCKECDGDVKFQTVQSRGLGYKIAVLCNTCAIREIPSSPFIGHSYEINRRFIFTMRVLGLGLKGCQKFCGMMDMPQFFFRSTYDLIINHMLQCIKEVSSKIFKEAVQTEKQQTCEAKNIETTTDLTVSGDGTWHKRGFTSLHGVSSIIGYYTGKILDIVVKSSYCKMCEFWEKKTGTGEYEEWLETHANECLANHEGSSGKMEVDAIVEMFRRSLEMYGVRYSNYIGDGDSTTYSGIINSVPYEDFTVTKKECIGHVQKRMGRQLRACKSKNKVPGGKGKLTGKMIDKLTVYYGLAIRRNCDSVENMQNAIWATYYHYNYDHSKCPTDADSWCEWQKASAAGEMEKFKHSYKVLPQDVLVPIKPIYENLSKPDLLQRCIGGFNQNNNESYNQLIWKIAPKIIVAGSKTVEIAAHVAACTFNEGFHAILQIYEAMGVHCGRNLHQFAMNEDAARIATAERRALEATREGRMHRRQRHSDYLEAASAAEGPQYGPGIDDSM